MSHLPPRCVLHRGDALAVLRTLPDRSIHCVITDPPYGSTDCHWDQIPDLDAWWTQIERVTTVGAVIAIFCAQPFTTRLINARPKWFRYDLVWDKLSPVGHLNANRQPLRVHEQILIFSQRPSAGCYQPQYTTGTPYRTKRKASTGGAVYSTAGAWETVNAGTRHPTSILRFAKPSRRQRRHPTEKSVPLLSWLVRSYSRSGQTVLDSFLGSASLAEAALLADRNVVGIERDPEIYETAVARIAPLLRPSQLVLPRGPVGGP